MKYLNELRFEGIEQILWLDLESASIEEEITEDSPYWDAWEQKVRWDEKIVTVEDIKQRYKERAPIYKEFAKIVSISYGRVSNGVLKVKNIVGEEKDIITELFKDVETFSAGGIKFLGVFSGKQFDVPFISYRAIANDVPCINSFDIGGIASWNIKHIIDVQDLLRATSSTSISLEGACASLKIPSPKTKDVSGKSVNDLFWAGEIEKISTYNNKDVLATCNLFCKYLQVPFVELLEVGEDKVQQQPILQRIYKAESIDESTKHQLKEIFDKKKLSVKDKKIAEDILISLYTNNTMFASDNPATKLRKKEEIKELIK